MAHQYMLKIFHDLCKNSLALPPTYLMYGPLQCQKNYSTQILQKLFTLMHQCMGGGHTVKKFQQEDHGLTQKRIGI